MGALATKLSTMMTPNSKKDSKKQRLLDLSDSFECCEGTIVNCNKTVEEFSKPCDNIMRVKCLDGEYPISNYTFEKLPYKVQTLNFYELEVKKRDLGKITEYLVSDEMLMLPSMRSTFIKCGIMEFIKESKMKVPSVPFADTEELYD